jgi:hypothetical protein
MPPGINPAIRTITRRALFHGAEVFAVRRGYARSLASRWGAAASTICAAASKACSSHCSVRRSPRPSLGEIVGKQKPLTPELFDLAGSVALNESKRRFGIANG